MNNCLAIDTSSQQATIGLQIAGRYYHSEINNAKAQAEQLLKCIDTLLAQAQTELKIINYIAIANGPGSFTGLRVGVSAAQALAYALEVPVVAIGSLQVLAQQAYEEYGTEDVLVAQDARMQEVYWGMFSIQEHIMQPVGEIAVDTPAQMLKKIGLSTEFSHDFPPGIETPSSKFPRQLVNEGVRERLALISNALETYPYFKEKFVKTYDFSAKASALIQLASAKFEANQVITPSELIPRYVRNKVAEKQQKK